MQSNQAIVLCKALLQVKFSARARLATPSAPAAAAASVSAPVQAPADHPPDVWAQLEAFLRAQQG